MNPLKGLMKKTDNSKMGIPLRPETPCWNIRHNGQTGTMTIMLPDVDPNDEKNSKGTEAPITSATFIPLFITKIARGQNSTSNPSLDQDGCYDVYSYTEEGSMNKGLFSDNSLKETPFKAFHRIFGFLVMLNGKNIVKYNGAYAEDVKSLFPENGIALAYADLSPQKYYSLAQDLNTTYDSIGEVIEAQFLTLTSDQDRSGTHFKSNKNGGAFTPVASLTSMKEEIAEKLYRSSESLINEVLIPYQKNIENNDRFLKELLLHGLTEAGTVKKLLDFGIKDSETLDEALGDGGWEKIYSLVNNGTLQSEKTINVDQSGTNSELTQNDLPDSFSDIDFSDDDLPF